MQPETPVNPVPGLKAMLEHLDRLVREWHTLSTRMLEVLDHNAPMSLLVDTAYLCRQAELIFDELRKEAKAKKEKLALAVSIAEVMSLMDGTPLATKGHLATVTVKTVDTPQVPAEDSSEYDSLIRFFGLDTDKFRTIGRIDFKKLSEYYETAVENNLNLPDVELTTFPQVRSTFRARSTPTDE